MSERLDKKTRKEKLHEVRASKRAAARAKLPLTDDQMQAMFDMLDAELPKLKCDHTLRLVRSWAEQQNIPFDGLASWCHENGGHCDCEVLANAEQQCREAIHDTEW